MREAYPSRLVLPRAQLPRIQFTGGFRAGNRTAAGRPRVEKPHGPRQLDYYQSWVRPSAPVPKTIGMVLD